MATSKPRAIFEGLYWMRAAGYKPNQVQLYGGTRHILADEDTVDQVFYRLDSMGAFVPLSTCRENFLGRPIKQVFAISMWLTEKIDAEDRVEALKGWGEDHPPRREEDADG